MTKRELARLRARVNRLKGYQMRVAELAGVSYMTIYRLKEGLWERFKADTLARIEAAVGKIERTGYIAL